METDIGKTLRQFKKAQCNQPNPGIVERMDRLSRLKNYLIEYKEKIAVAIQQDFSHRSVEETLLLELLPTLNTIRYCKKHLKSWSKKRPRHVSWQLQPASAYLSPQPLGVVGIMVPWNYPIFLAMVPLSFALAAGNRVMIKTSELSSNLGTVIKDCIKAAGLEDCVAIVSGDVEVAKQFASMPFDHLLFTGSTAVGKSVMKAASEHLTPVTLELGGKSPAIISQSVDKRLLKRLFIGKMWNAGQTCIAPDYVCLPKDQEEAFVSSISSLMEKHYPYLLNNPNYTAIVSDAHMQRLTALLEDAKKKGGRILPIGADQSKNRKMPLFLILNVHSEMKVMQEEIFGPILPLLTYKHFDEACQVIRCHPNPLALYYFGSNKEEIEVLKNIRSGALVINDTMMHCGVDDLPFGGIGESGMGRYHGREGFDTFSHLKPVFVQKKVSPVSFLYPPYGKLLTYFLKLSRL